MRAAAAPLATRVQGGMACCPPAPSGRRAPSAAAAAAALRAPRRSSSSSTGVAARTRRHIPCRAVEEDVIDVEGTVVDDRVPVTVITGFLGSGKTTLLNQILRGGHGHRIAVIENEFGEVDIDSELVSLEEALDPGQEQIMMLNNGCLCCTVREDLVQMLNKLSERRAEFDRVVIETTGLANPAPVIQTFFLEPTVADTMKLDGVVTLVDAKHIELHLDEEKPEGVVNEAVEQVAYADRIVLNKTDLVTPADLERLEQRISAINGMATVRRAQQANVPVDYVLGVGGFDLEKVDEEVMAAGHHHDHAHSHDSHHDHECGGAGCTHESHAHDHGHAHAHAHDDHDGAESSHDHGHAHSHSHHDHKHDDAVRSVSFTVDGEMDLDKVNYWLGGLIELKSNDLYRMKGVLAIKDFERRFVFQGVHMMFEGMPDRLWKEGEKRSSKMVFIGRDLDEPTIREGFEECIVR